MRAFALTATALITAGGPVPLAARALSTGDSLWTAQTESDGVLAAGDATLVTASGRRLIGIDAATGRTSWSVDMTAPPLGPVVTSGLAVVAAGSLVRALHLADGTEAWQTDLGAPISLVPAVSATRVVLSLSDNSLTALDLGTGARTWRTSMDFVASYLSTTEDSVVVTTKNHLLCSYRLPAKKPSWCHSFGIPAAGPAVFDDRNVYVAYLDNTVRVFKRGDGAMRASPTLSNRPKGRMQFVGSLLAVPLTTATASFVSPAESFLVLPLTSPDDALLPELQGFAASEDGEYVVLFTASSAGYKLTTLKKVGAAPPQPAAPPTPDPSPTPATR
jgi:hypothetical protein